MSDLVFAQFDKTIHVTDGTSELAAALARIAAIESQVAEMQPVVEALGVIGKTMPTDDMPVLNAIASTEDDWIVVTLRGSSHVSAEGETLADALISLAAALKE